uniref:Uncharacterized protein n=1 Tax=Raphanus sativus TaxID=3726 RepID=A0A650GPF7_RAPSA|nr:hypothetical protein [Raphanus sativus]QGW48612.1 hypothetical protein [Raphanus sativus]
MPTPTRKARTSYTCMHRNRAKPETDQFKELIPNGEKEYLLLCDSNRAASRSVVPALSRRYAQHGRQLLLYSLLT